MALVQELDYGTPIRVAAERTSTTAAKPASTLQTKGTHRRAAARLKIARTIAANPMATNAAPNLPGPRCDGS